MGRLYTSRRKSDGKPRKLRKATHPRAIRRQARRIKEQQLGRKLGPNERVHHGGGFGTQRGLTVENPRNHAHRHTGPGTAHPDGRKRGRAGLYRGKRKKRK